MVHNLTRNTDDTYIYRLYPEYGTLRYLFAMPVSYRGNGEFEAHAWNSLAKLCTGISLGMFPEILCWIHDELKHVDIRFKMLTGTFETDRLPAYARLFRKSVTINKLRRVWQTYNGAGLDGWTVEFIPLEMEKK
jgi:hypothetical protein